MENGELPQLKGFVIITLPPSDKPFLGKTISAFTLSDSPPAPSDQEPQQNPQHQQPQLPIQLPSNPENQFSSRRLLSGAPRTSLGLLGVSLIALVLWVSASPQILFESHSLDDHKLEDHDEKPNSFIFPLFPKLSIREMSQRVIELKLGRFVDVNSDIVVSQLDDGMRASKIVKSISAAESTAILPVRGNNYPDGLYYTYMLLGNPPRPYFLDIDTGSDLAWIQCDAPCTSCAKGPHPFYKPTKGNIIPSEDSLCVEVQGTQRTEFCEMCPQCDYEIEYADHSSSIGVLTRDKLHLLALNGSLVKSKVVFGCAYDQQGLLLNSLSKTDGILGLSRAKVSLPSQLASQGIINNVIGHCLTADAGGGGYMFLGNDFVPYNHLSWVKMLNIPSTNSYVAEVFKISYGNKQLNLAGLYNGPGHVVFDSGSSYTYFTKQAYSNLVASLKDVSAEGLILDASDTMLPVCWRANFSVRSALEVRQFFKPLTFQFGKKWLVVSVKLTIPPEGYLVVNNKGNVCLGILDGSEVHDGSTIILGDISLRGQLVVYDNVNQKIGWMQSDCTKPKRFKSFP